MIEASPTTTRGSRTRRWAGVALWSASVPATLLVLGFAIFVTRLPDPEEAQPERLAFAARGPAGIVALTGGAGSRITRAVELHEAGLGERVFISGVNPRITKAVLAADERVAGREETFACCVDLGPFAKTTKGNALEARSWLRRQGYQTVYLVTSNFHLPRATLELSMLAPELTIVGVPVDSWSVPAADWPRRPRSWRTLAKEYAKLLLARARGTFQPEPRTRPE